MEIWTLFGNIVALLAGSLLLGGLFSRMGQSPLVGYLLAGMALGGPGSLHVVGSNAEIETVAELGVALLLFSIGLEFSPERIRKLGLKPLIGGAAQVIVTTIIGTIGFRLFGLGLRESIAVGAMTSLSSTAVVLRLLTERAELELPHGRNGLAVLLAQDMAVVPLVLLMTLLSGTGGAAAVALGVGRVVLMTGALIAGLWLLNRLAVFALEALTLHRNRELTTLLAVVSGLGSTWAAHAAGISPALGAFVAGMLLGSSVFATQIRADVSSFRVVLATLFFGAAGLVADPTWMLRNWLLVAGVTVLLTAVKLLVTWAVFQQLGGSRRVSAATGLCLAQVGEFAFVLGNIGRENGVLSTETYELIVSSTILSFAFSAFLIPRATGFGNLAASWFGARRDPEEPDVDTSTAPEVVVIGFGPVGQLAARAFADNGESVSVIDLNQHRVRQARELGFHGVLGDAAMTEVLEHAHVTRAQVIVVAVPDFLATLAILDHVREAAPHLHVVARSRYQIHTERLLAAGTDVVIEDEREAGEALARNLRDWLNDGAEGRHLRPWSLNGEKLAETPQLVG